MGQEIIITINRGEFRPGEIQSVADEIADAVSDHEVSIGTRVRSTMRGGPLPEVVHILLSGTAEYVVAKAIEATSRAVQALWERRRAQEEHSDPVGIEIIGPKGEVLSRVLCSEPDGEPQPYVGRMGPLGARPAPIVWRHGPRADD